MIQTLRKKFVFTAMAAVTVLILFMLGAINIANIILVRSEMDRTLRMISENDGSPNKLLPPSAPPGFSIRMPENDYDTFLSSNFFIVRFDPFGNIVSCDISRTSSITEDTAGELARQALMSHTNTGKTGSFRYLLKTSPKGNVLCAVFLDTSRASVSYLRVLLLSCAVGFACWGVMLVFVISRSARAIRPIAENFMRQKQFVTNAGHELKTPLAIILSNTEAMELYHGETKWSANIKNQAERLNGLMKNLLALARMDETEGKAPSEAFSLDGLLTELLLGFLQPMEAKDISLYSDLTPDIRICANREQIEQLLSILLDNAVKYTNPQGQIRISLQKNGRLAKLAFQNTCDALPDVPPEKLFERFYRADAARTQKNGGYGIALSMASAIVSANNGTIQAAYHDCGSICFTVSFKFL